MSAPETSELNAASPLDPTKVLPRFLLGFTPIVYGFAIVFAGLALAFGGIGTVAAAAISLAVGISLTLALLLVRRGRLTAAALAACASLLAGAGAVGFVLPQVATSTKFAPMLVIALALLHLERRVLAGVIVLSSATAIALAVIQEVLRKATPDPVWIDQLLRISIFAVIVTPTAYLLWLSSARLRALLDLSASTNDALVAAERRTSAVNDELRVRVDELRRRNLTGRLLSETAEALQACDSTDEAYEVIVRSGGQLLPGTAGVLHIINPSRDLIEVVASWGAAPEGRSPFEPQGCLALRRGRAHLFAGNEGGRCPHLADAGSSLASLCLPLMARSETLGVLAILRPTEDAAEPIEAQSPPTDEITDGLEASDDENAEAGAVFPTHLQLMGRRLAEFAALRLANLRLRETLLTQSTRDPLTGLFNRRFMEESLTRELRRAAREETELAVLMLDLDHFKVYNDTHGHEAGDTALRSLGEYLMNHVRGEDIACRYGGEEFAIILPGASLEDAKRLADLMRVGVRNLSVSRDTAAMDPVTVSIGLAVYPHHGTTGDELLRAADAALYDAKRRGRDRTRLAKQPV